MPKSRLYTRGGDRGRTRLGDGTELSKSHWRIECLGTLDELNAVLGVILSQTSDPRIVAPLTEVQRTLFVLGSGLSNAEGIERIPRPEVGAEAVAALEASIDALDAALPELRHFILPGGDPVAAAIHLGRAVCRRAERSVAALNEEHSVPAETLVYLNRLSDYLFALARAVNHWNHAPEVLWH